MVNEWTDGEDEQADQNEWRIRLREPAWVRATTSM